MSPLTERQAELNRRFDFHANSRTDHADQHHDLRQAAKAFAAVIYSVVPPGREQSLALTKVEEALFWGNAGVARPPASP